MLNTIGFIVQDIAQLGLRLHFISVAAILFSTYLLLRAVKKLK
jgi:hypothetical protein